jgi:hypothetical protein
MLLPKNFQKIFKYISVFFLLLSLNDVVLASEKKDNFLDWKVFSNVVNGNKYCYMVSIPVKKSSVRKSGTVSYFIISSHDDVDEITISCGYELKRGYDLELFVGLQKFFLMTYENLSWTKNSYSDIEIIKELMKVEKVTTYCVSKKNTDSFQTYSLLGFRESYYKMKDECEDG